MPRDLKMTPEWFASARAAQEIGDLAEEIDSWVDRVLAYSRGGNDPKPAEPVAVAA
jgi:hypothetical protein